MFIVFGLRIFRRSAFLFASIYLLMFIEPERSNYCDFYHLRSFHGIVDKLNFMYNYILLMGIYCRVIIINSELVHFLFSMMLLLPPWNG